MFVETNVGHVQVPEEREILYDMSSFDTVWNVPLSTSDRCDFGMDLGFLVTGVCEWTAVSLWNNMASRKSSELLLRLRTLKIKQGAVIGNVSNEIHL